MGQKEFKLLLSYTYAHKYSSAGRRMRLLNERHLSDDQWNIITSNLSESSSANVTHISALFSSSFTPISYKSSRVKLLFKKILTAFLWPDRGVFWMLKAYKAASKHVKAEDHTRLVATGYPFSSILTGALVKFRNKKKVTFIAHYIDAFYLVNKGNGTPFYFTPLNYLCEKFVNNQADKIIVNQTKKDLFIKTFPKSVDKAEFVTELPGRIITVDNSKVEKGRYFYAGSLYQKIRNPKKVLELFQKIDSHLVLAGTLNDCSDLMQKYSSNKLQHIGMLDATGMEEQYETCQFLVNIDNQDVAQQPPGKIIEYMLLQKPIINFYKGHSVSGGVLKAHSLSTENYLEIDLDASFEENLALLQNFNPPALSAYYKVDDEYENIFRIYNDAK